MTTEIKLHEIGKLLTRTHTHTLSISLSHTHIYLHGADIAVQFGWPFKPN